MENLLYRLRQNRGEESTAYTTRFESALSKVEELITAEQRAESRRHAELARAECRRQSLDFIVALQSHNDAIAAMPEGAEAPAAPIAPVPPAAAEVRLFTLPEVRKGFLYLRHVGISLATRSSLLRSSGGSLRFDKVSELLRKTELDALVASKTTHQASHSYLADAVADEEEFEDYDEEAYFIEDQDDDYAWLAEHDAEDEEGSDDPEEDLEPDEKMDTAMLGYLEARKKLLSLRRARGFKEPGEAPSGSKDTSYKPYHKDHPKGRSGRKGSGKGKGSKDFQWVHKPDRNGKGRNRTPPPTRRAKARGRNRLKGCGRREPAGSQYLGMAFAPNPVTFQRTVQVVSRLVDRVLSMDGELGLETLPLTSGDSEQCRLVTPLGHAILDTGCTSTLVGSENERLWRKELQRITNGTLQPEESSKKVRFEGINGKSKATCQVKYPVRIANHDGFIQASVIPGKAPFLLSIKALRQMKAKLDCGRDVLEIPRIGEVSLTVNGVGHYMLPFLNFSGKAEGTRTRSHHNGCIAQPAGFRAKSPSS